MTEKKIEQHIVYFFPSLSKYDLGSVKVDDQGLARYINLDTGNMYRGAVFANKMFEKQRYHSLNDLLTTSCEQKNIRGRKLRHIRS